MILKYMYHCPVILIFIFTFISNHGCMLSLALLHEAGAKNSSSSFSTEQDNGFWISQAGNYTLGFKNASNGEHLLSIWHTGDPNRKAIWWPILNKSVPATVDDGGFFNYTELGDMELHSSNGILIWSVTASSTYAELQDTGNLRLLSSNQSVIIWQSFHDCRDSLMLSDVDFDYLRNKSRLLQSRINDTSFSEGKIYLATDDALNARLHSADVYNNDFVYLLAVIQNTSGAFIILDPSLSNSYTVDPSIAPFTRLTLDPDGNLRIYEWDSNKNAWLSLWQMFYLECRIGSPCGPFGICIDVDADGAPNCMCPYGYHAASVDDPALGCVNNAIHNISLSSSCSSSNVNAYNLTMVVVQNIDYFYNDIQSQSGIQQSDCENLCLKNCSCIAASYDVTNGQCFLKGNVDTGYIMNGITSDSVDILLKIVLPFGNGTVDESSKNKKNAGIFAFAVGVPTTCLVVGVVAWYLCKKKKKLTKIQNKFREQFQGQDMVNALSSALSFEYGELEEATNGFKDALGEGGFGKVYKGWLKEQSIVEAVASNLYASHRASDLAGIPIAVKILKAGKKKTTTNESNKQFQAEVSTLGKIHHVNLVKLLGYCSIKDEQVINVAQRNDASHDCQVESTKYILVYEYLERGSLDTYMIPGISPLPWPIRFSIALGTARGIAYLHHDCRPPILHCDIKPQNVLLDENFTAKVADFGFAQHFHDQHFDSCDSNGQNNNNSKQVAFVAMSAMRGTPGYMAPEWVKTNKITSKVDVYSYGKLLLDLVHGLRRSRYDDMQVPLKEWAMQCISAGTIISLGCYMAATDSVDSEHDHETMINGEDVSYTENEVSQMLQVLKIALWCIHPSPLERPSMAQVVQLLECMPGYSDAFPVL